MSREKSRMYSLLVILLKILLNTCDIYALREFHVNVLIFNCLEINFPNTIRR